MKLKKILSLPSGENVYFVTEYILNFAKSNKLKFKMDGEGNIYITKGESDIYPCVTAHIDTVHSFGDINIIETNGKYSSKIGIGGDDKVGVFCCLSLLKALKVLKVAFFNGEERGCVGSRNPWKAFFQNVGYLIAIDRRGNSDYINQYGGSYTTSKTFDEKIKEILDKNGYEPDGGLLTDALKLQSDEVVSVSTCNFSCGYYKPHTVNEYVVQEDVFKALKMIYKIIIKLGNKKYPHKKDYTAKCDWCQKPASLDKLEWKSGSRLCPDCAGTAEFFSDNTISKTQNSKKKSIQFIQEMCSCCKSYYDSKDLIIRPEIKTDLFKNNPKRIIKLCIQCNSAYEMDNSVLNEIIY